MTSLMTQTGWDGLEKLEEELGKVASAPEGLCVFVFVLCFVFVFVFMFSFVFVFVSS